ncbi:MAG: hypothetical protein Q9170_007078 [Blastenia crenularia]
MSSALPIQRPRTPSDSCLPNESPLSPSSESKDRHGSLRRRPSFSFLRRSKSRDGVSRTVSTGTTRSSSGGSLSGRKLSKKKLVLAREKEMRQENIPPFPPRIPDIPRTQTLQTFGGENYRPESSAIISGKTDTYTAGRSCSYASRETPGLAISHNVPIPPIPNDSHGGRSPVDPYGRAESMTHRGRYSYASSAVSTIDGPRRLRRRKDPTPFNILVVGARNSGKTSFLNFLRSSLAQTPQKHRPSVADNTYDVHTVPPTIGYPNFTPHLLETTIGSERVSVTLWDSQGLERNVVDLQLREMSSFVESKFEETFTEENRVVRTPGFRDTHIHCVFLLLDPARLDANIAAAKMVDAISGAKVNGNSFAVHRPAGTSGGLDENLDLQVMRVLRGKTTVIPVVAKADTITTAHMAYLKRAVWDSIKRGKLDDYETVGLGENAEEESSEDEQVDRKGRLPAEDPKLSDRSHLDSPSDSEASSSSSDFNLGQPRRPPGVRQSRTPSSPVSVPMRPQAPAETPYLPLSIISPDLYEPDVLGRKFPWGFADPFDAEHCDFIRLKDMIFSEWRGDLREASREPHRPRCTVAKMNDPGLDEPIQQQSNNVEQERKDEEQFQKEDEQAFLDPRLIAVNTISLVLALVANVALLLNMARRLSFAIAQPITIVGWFIASILLIALVITATYSLQLPGQDRALTQAFYYAILAAGIYFVIASLMCVTVYGAYKEHYPQEFKLTMSQRTLMLQTISFMVYMLGGAAVYYRVEGWQFLDCVYFTNYTLLTVGIGDYAPLTHTGRALLFPYAIGGIVILGLVIGSIRSLVLERGKKKLGSRMVEKKREQLLERLHKKGQHKKLKPINSDEQADELGMTERERRKFEFEMMRQIQDNANQRQKWNALFISGSAWLVLWLVGGVVFWKAEHAQEWSYFGALYFSYTSLLTIGYGDYKNFSNAGKPAFVFWSLLAVPTLTIVISNMGDTVVKAIRDVTNYLGEFTVLPGESPTRQRAKQMVTSVTDRFGRDQGKEKMMDEPPGMIGEKEQGDDDGPRHGAMVAATDRLAGDIEKEELHAVAEAKRQGDKISEDVHEYHFQLIREFRNVMKHLNESPPRRYTYEEWAWFLKLMGENEDNQLSHRQAPIQPRTADHKEADIQQGTTDDKEQSERQWSWLGNRSPLMGEVDEPEWVLERLSITLEKEMRKQFDEQRRARREGMQDAKQKPLSSSGSSKTLEQQS